MNRSFYSLLSSRSFANLAGSLYMMTLIAAVYQLTGSAAFAGAVSFVRSIAVLSSSFSLPFWYTKLTVANVTRLFLLLQCALSGLVAFSLAPLSSILPASAFLGYAFGGIVLIGYVEGCASAAANALYPRLVEEDKRVQANSLVSTSMQMLSLLGWTAGGILVAKLGHSFVLQLSSGLLLLGCLFLVRLSHNEQIDERKAKGSRSMLAGWTFLFTHPQMRIITWMDIVEGIAGGIWIGGVTLVFAQEVLQKDEAWWGYINAAYYAGTIYRRADYAQAVCPYPPPSREHHYCRLLRREPVRLRLRVQYASLHRPGHRPADGPVLPAARYRSADLCPTIHPARRAAECIRGAEHDYLCPVRGVGAVRRNGGRYVGTAGGIYRWRDHVPALREHRVYFEEEACGGRGP
ncbi:MFS transporter [Paenibacillus thiaminolyticus]|uniref:MFS transporter n=1 Tax=Paenibacillus thiaminolyticus TaxID=49283 RepID=UPI0035A70276